MTYGLKEAHDELLSELEDLREKYAEVCETSAMLRVDMAAARERQAKLRDENKKLRELVRDAVSLAAEHCDEYDQDDGYCHTWCPWDNVTVVRDGEPAILTCQILHMYDRMRELGVEVA